MTVCLACSLLLLQPLGQDCPPCPYPPPFTPTPHPTDAQLGNPPEVNWPTYDPDAGFTPGRFEDCFGPWLDMSLYGQQSPWLSGDPPPPSLAPCDDVPDSVTNEKLTEAFEAIKAACPVIHDEMMGMMKAGALNIWPMKRNNSVRGKFFSNGLTVATTTEFGIQAVITGFDSAELAATLVHEFDHLREEIGANDGAPYWKANGTQDNSEDMHIACKEAAAYAASLKFYDALQDAISDPPLPDPPFEPPPPIGGIPKGGLIPCDDWCAVKDMYEAYLEQCENSGGVPTGPEPEDLFPPEGCDECP